MCLAAYGVGILTNDHDLRVRARSQSEGRKYVVVRWIHLEATTLLLDALLETGPIFTLGLSPEKVVPVLPEVQPDSSPSGSLPLEARSGPSRSPRNSWSFR